MYTVVMMMAMSGGGEVTAYHRCASRCAGWSCNGGRGWGCNRRACNGGGCACSRSVCNGCHGCAGGGVYRAPAGVEKVPAPRPKEEVRVTQPATIFVSLPAEAQLFVDEQQTMSTAAERRFTTPPLVPGATYYYTLKANFQQNGRPVTLTRQVNVRAGEESRVAFTMPAVREAVGEESEPPNNINAPPKALPPPRDR